VAERWTTDGSPAGIICPRCKRLAVGWMYERGDRCAPAGWRDCIRDPYAIVTGGKPFEWAMLWAPVVPVGGSAAMSRG